MRIARVLVFTLMCGYVAQALGRGEYNCEPVSKPKIMLNKNYWFEISGGRGMLCGEDLTADACANGDIVWRNESNRPFVKCDTNGTASTWAKITTISTCSGDKTKYDEFVKLGDKVYFYKYANKGKNRYKIAKDGYCQIPAADWCIGGKWNNNQCDCGENKTLNKNSGECENNQEHKVDETQVASPGSSSDFKKTQKESKIAGTCNYKKGDGVTLGDYYLPKGSDVIPCNMPGDDKTCIINDIIIPVNVPMICSSNGWRRVDIKSLDENCDKNKFTGYQSVSTDEAVFYYKTEKGSAKITDLHGCAKKQPASKTESQPSSDKSVAEQKCKINGTDYTVGTDTRPNTKYVVCKESTDCNNATLPNATELRCSGANGDTCGSCIAEKCKENFTVKRVDGRNFGFCIMVAEQNCIDAVGDKKWNSKTKKCDCGERIWDDVTNTCKEQENEKREETEPPAQPVSTTCDESKGLKPSESNPQECVCTEDGAEYNKEKDRCEKAEAGLVKVEIGDEHDEERKKLEEARKKTEQEYKSARDNEQSDANKALTAAAVAAGGLGGMEWAQGRAEQLADADAEREMSAYITTMKCEYGGGQQVNLGAEETLPGGNEMFSYKTEFKQLAEKLKATKAALNLRPGIESEVIYDRAETGLYDYQTAETSGGANPSLSRALMNPDGTDATAWNAQKQESADKVQGGKTTAGVGVIGGAVGNAAINTDVIKNVVEKIGK